MKQKNAQHSIELAELQQKLDWQNSMLSSTENALVSTDLSGTIVSFNTAAEKLFGYTADEVVDIHTGAVVHLEEEIIAYAKELSLELNKTIAPGFEVLVLLSLNNSRQIKKWNMVRKNGSQFPARVIVKAIYDQQGDAIGFLADIIDLTELNKTRKKEKENITLYKDLFESFSYALFLLDGEYLVDCNSATLKMFECTKEQIIGQLASRFTPERQLDGRLSSEKIVEVLNLALAGESYLMEWLACRYDGTLIRTELSLNVVYMDGKPYVHAAVRDITEHYNLQQTLASERIRLKSIFNDMQTMIGILDVDGKLIFINNTPLNITGVKEGEVLNTLFSQATWFNYDENLTKKFNRILKIH